MLKKYIALLFVFFSFSVFAENVTAQGLLPTESSQKSASDPVVSQIDGATPSRLVFALAAPYTTITDSVSFAALADFWTHGYTSANALPTDQIYIPEESEAQLERVFQSAPSGSIKIASPANLLSQVYQEDAWAILPFEALEPRYKVVQLDGQSPLSNTFDLNAWPLTAKTGGTPDMTEADWRQIPAANRDPEKLTTLMLTGVTALVRGTASYMDVWGPGYPATNIGDTLRAADILHVNNEVPFKTVCQQTAAELNQLRFCSKIAYFDLLTGIGTDVIELAGDHFQDFGDEAMVTTLALYQENGIPYYGGGKDLEEARKPLLFEHNQNRFAFIGCNAKEIGYSSATETSPGAAHCDFPYLIAQVKSLRAEGYLPIVTFQHIEYYNVSPNDQMREDFNAVAEAGAVIVSGSQSHIPMAFAISENAFIHYGLGNLFFDQAFFLQETSEATLDRHVFYAGRHIGTELLTIKFTNLALNRFMTESERQGVLERIFKESIVSVE